MNLMHDWTLLSVLFDWKDARVTLCFTTDRTEEMIVATSVVDLHVPQSNEWGPSVSVNGVKGPFESENGRQSIEIEMQSGDVIRIVASSFMMPKRQSLAN
jgi:hypothetical protein